MLPLGDFILWCPAGWHNLLVNLNWFDSLLCTCFSPPSATSLSVLPWLTAKPHPEYRSKTAQKTMDKDTTWVEKVQQGCFTWQRIRDEAAEVNCKEYSVYVVSSNPTKKIPGQRSGLLERRVGATWEPPNGFVGHSFRHVESPKMAFLALSEWVGICQPHLPGDLTHWGKPPWSERTICFSLLV